MQRCGAATADDAITQGRATVRAATSTADAWAFAYDAQTVISGQRSRAIHVEFWAKGMAGPAALIQPYDPMSDSAKFKIIGDPIIERDGIRPPRDALTRLLESIRKGIASHPKVSALWNSWR